MLQLYATTGAGGGGGGGGQNVPFPFLILAVTILAQRLPMSTCTISSVRTDMIKCDVLSSLAMW